MQSHSTITGTNDEPVTLPPNVIYEILKHTDNTTLVASESVSTMFSIFSREIYEKRMVFETLNDISICKKFRLGQLNDLIKPYMHIESDRIKIFKALLNIETELFTIETYQNRHDERDMLTINLNDFSTYLIELFGAAGLFNAKIFRFLDSHEVIARYKALERVINLSANSGLLSLVNIAGVSSALAMERGKIVFIDSDQTNEAYNIDEKFEQLIALIPYDRQEYLARVDEHCDDLLFLIDEFNPPNRRLFR